MNRIFTASLIILILVATVSSCTGGYKYSDYREVATEGWPYGERFDYTVTGRDSVFTGTLMVSLTHDNSYEYSNIWLEVTVPGDSTVMVDTVNVTLCDPYGNWYGNGMPGHYQFTDTLVGRPLTIADSSRITVRHIMRVDTLRGISQVGISLEPVK
ncbi:MAG: gliding motility lipoprotein GldH [Muribaculaceae bacterium]|nr:gliding motility lipoprotein GldH [Muribaculaceae bacterium]